MTTTQLLIVCVTAIIIVAFVASALANRAQAETNPFEHLQAGQRVAVFSSEGIGIRGTVAEQNGQLALVDASMIQSGNEAKLQGTVRIPTASAAFVQELERAT